MKGSKHRVESIERGLRRSTFGIPSLAEALTRAGESLLHGPCCNDERRRDLGGRQTDHRGERECGTLAVIERRMTAGEDQGEELVLPAARDVAIADRDPDPRAHLRKRRYRVAVSLDALRAPQPIAMAVAGDRDE